MILKNGLKMSCHKNFMKIVSVGLVFIFAAFFPLVCSAQDAKYKSQKVKTGDSVLFDGFCVDYAGMAFLLTAPEAEKKKCLLEKEEIKETNKLETEKVIKQLEAEYKKKLEMCELVNCKEKKDNTPYNWKWVAGGFVVGVVVGVVSVFAAQNLK